MRNREQKTLRDRGLRAAGVTLLQGRKEHKLLIFVREREWRVAALIGPASKLHYC